MKQIFLRVFCLFVLWCCYGVSLQAQGNTCIEADPFCTDSGITFPAGVDVPDASVTEPGNNYDCLSTQPNPAWYYLQIADPGDIVISEFNSNSVDVDFALWGPYENLNEALGQCGSLPTPTDCSYSASPLETITVPNSTQGQVYVLLITNYGNAPTDISAEQTDGTGSTNCDIVICEPPVADPVANSTCVGGQIQLSGFPNIEGATYAWTGPNGFSSNQQNPVIINATLANAGAYTLIITTECASDPVSVTATVTPIPVEISGNTSICEGNSSTLSAGDYTTYLWSNGAITPTISVTTAGEYCVTVTSADGCVGEDCINISISPSYSVNNTVSICQGESYFVGGGSQTEAGTYSDTFTTVAGCDSIIVTQLIVNPLPPAINLNNQTICEGSNATFSIDLGNEYNYAWSNGSSNNSITVVDEGTYTVSVSNNCGTQTASGILSITPEPEVAFEDEMAQFCVETDNELMPTATAGVNYTWSNGSNGNTLPITTTGVYSVTVSNSCGTSATSICATVASCQPCDSLRIIHTYICSPANGTYDIYAGAAGGTPPYTITGTGSTATLETNEMFIFYNLPEDMPYIINATDATGCIASVCYRPDCGLLPIELIRFAGELKGSDNLLTWVTANEINNDYFILQRSADNANFKDMAQIDGAGNSNTQHLYEYVDHNAPIGKYYYRLIQVDFDGKRNIAGTTILERNSKGLNINYIQPIPAQNIVELSFNSTSTQDIEVLLHNAVGQLVQREHWNSTEGTNMQTLDISTLPAGVYTITLYNNLDRSVQLLVKE